MMIIKRNTIIISIFVLTLLALLSGCAKKQQETQEAPNLKEVAYEAFIYAYPMMEQVKTINGMFEFMGMKPNVVAMNPRYPMDNVGQPIVAPNLTSMTGGLFIDISAGPVTLEIPEVKDRYIVYQFVDVFTHNFYYLGTRANGGEAGRFTFYNKNQPKPDSSTGTPVLLKTEANWIGCLRFKMQSRWYQRHLKQGLTQNTTRKKHFPPPL
jgi:hypothetical protein